MPIAVVYHDDKINPRAIGANVRGLVEEFHRGRPQLHAALAWMQINDSSRSTIHVFDGQHKAAAQILLGVQALPVRVFVDPNFEVLLTANTNAGTTLRQVAFDKSVQRRLGSVMLRDRIARYCKEKGYAEDFSDFSERDLVEFYRGEQRQITRYVLDGVRDAITFSPENGLRDFIEAAGKGTEKPFSYSTIEKTLYSKFISQKMLSTPMNYRQEQGENPRDVEISQIVKLMTTIADKLYVGKFDEDLGTKRIESLVQKGEIIPETHLRAFRVAKEEVFYCWIGYVGKIVEYHFLTNGGTIDGERLFQYVFPPALWANIENFIVNLSQMPMWANREASATVFRGKQTYSFWQQVFETGTSPSGQKLMPSGMDIMKMIAPR